MDRGAKRVAMFAWISRIDRRVKRVAIIAFVSGLLFASGVALAEWLANGTGSGYATAGSAQNLTTSTAIASGTLYPGGTGDMGLTVNNPNPYPVTVTSVVGAGPIVSSSAACNAGGHGVTFTNQTGLSLVVPAQGSATFVLAGSVSMAESSANECQGATFEIPVSLTGVSGTSGTGGGGPVDADLDTFTSVATGGTDCDDTDASIHPGAVELVNNLDDDCDGLTDEGIAQITGYPDLDADGYGDPTGGQPFNTLPEGYVLDGTDCDDNNETVNPGAIEVPDPSGVDENCDGFSQVIGYLDLDTDGYGTGQALLLNSLQLGFAANNGDCNDNNSAIHPGMAEVQDGLDNDCDGIVDDGFVIITGYPDVDGDGHGDALAGGNIFFTLPAGYVDTHDDCDDADEMVHPGAVEVLNGVDDDCDGVIDDNPIDG